MGTERLEARKFALWVIFLKLIEACQGALTDARRIPFVTPFECRGVFVHLNLRIEPYPGRPLALSYPARSLGGEPTDGTRLSVLGTAMHIRRNRERAAFSARYTGTPADA